MASNTTKMSHKCLLFTNNEQKQTNLHTLEAVLIVVLVANP